MCVCTFVTWADAQNTSPQEDAKQKAISIAKGRMGEMISTKDFQEKMPFGTFLEKLNQQLSKEPKVAVRFDRDAFSKGADKILKEEISLPPVPSRMSASLALRLALAQSAGDKYEIEFLPVAEEIVVTTRDRSLYTATYDIRELLPHTQALREELKHFSGAFGNEFQGPPPLDLDADPAKPAEWIVRQLMADDVRAGWRNRKPASTIRVVNGTKLIVHTAPSVHDEIEQLLSVLRRLADLAVAISSRVYELERAEYDAAFAAAFVDPKDKTARKLVATVSEAQWKRLQSMKPILHEGDRKLVPNVRGEFLAVRNAYQYQAKPGDATATTSFEGMSFTVRPLISPDRRCLRLEISRDVAQLVKITKGTMVDLKTGKDAPVDLPNIRKSSRTQMIEIHDGQPVLLAVDYLPKDKVWLVLAEPRIYMEEEEELIRKAANKRMPFADEPPPPPEVPLELVKEPAPKAPVQAPNSDEVRQILHAVVESVMTHRDLKSTREFYGTPKEAKFALDNGQIRWPKDFDPRIAGFTRVEQPGECRFDVRNRLMGIRLDKFDWDARKAVKEFSIEVVISNVGGQANGAVIGGCIVTYTAKREGKRWVVQIDSILDP